MVIKPTIGRVVWFWKKLPLSEHEQPQAAIVTAVWGDYCINVAIFDGNGNPVVNPPTSVRIVQEGETRPDFPHCTWMPYQVGQAKAAAAPTA